MLNRWPFHELPLQRWSLLVLLAVVCGGAGIGLDLLVSTAPDRVFHDAIHASHPREEWQHTAIVAIDHAIPPDVARLQMLPLFALAADRAVAAGAEAVFLDGGVLLYPNLNLPYATCVNRGEIPPTVEWAEPSCQPTGEDCRLKPSLSRPMAMKPDTAERFMMLPPISPGGGAAIGCDAEGLAEPRPLEWLLGMRAARKVTLVCSDFATPAGVEPDEVHRWVPLQGSHVVPELARRSGVWTEDALEEATATCHLPGVDGETGCRRTWNSAPRGEFITDERPVLPLSALADCDEAAALESASELEGRVVIFYPATFAERVDLHPTPMSAGWFSKHHQTPGPQFLADGVETLLAGDHPRRAPLAGRILLIVFLAVAGVLAGARLRVSAAALVPLMALTGSILLSLVSTPLVLWPITAACVTAALGVAATVGVHLVIGTRQGQIASRYLPAPVRKLLVEVGGPARLRDRNRFSVVMMSDLKSYTTATGLLQEAANIFALLNDYLDITTSQMQDRHNAWLEGYVGDEVCFYWPDVEDTEDQAMERALHAAVDLERLQRSYFEGLPGRQIGAVPPDVLRQVSDVLGAGIGMASGTVLMGNQGPERGVQKFGILGDTLNLASRIEGLTRYFDAHIIITSALASKARQLGLRVRRLGAIRVKGRLDPEDVFELGDDTSERLDSHAVAAWEQWLAEVEAGGAPVVDDASLFAADMRLIHGWVESGFLDADSHAWVLTKK